MTALAWFMLGGTPLLILVALLLGPAMVKGLLDRRRESV